MLLNYAGVKFEDERISVEEFDQRNAKGEFPSGYVPIYIDEQGRILDQAGALLIMLGKKYNLYGKDIRAGYEDDWAKGTFDDIFKKDYYMLWVRQEVSDEEIKDASEKFAKWNSIVD